MKSNKSGIGNTQDLRMATENSSKKRTEAFVRKGSKMSTTNNTMDFIDKWIANKEEGGAMEDNYLKSLNGSDFKIPEYEGIQTSLMKRTGSKMTDNMGSGTYKIPERGSGTYNFDKIENVNVRNEERL